MKKKRESFVELLDLYLTAREDWLLSTRSRGTSFEFEREMEERLKKAARKLETRFKNHLPSQKTNLE